MSEVQSRHTAPRGRGSQRGGRGGFRGGRGASKNTKSDAENVPPSSEDQGEIGELKMRHGSKVSTVRELFPDWTDEDVVFALEETGGDLESTIERITNGTGNLSPEPGLFLTCVFKAASLSGVKCPRSLTDPVPK
jgi:CUE domain